MMKKFICNRGTSNNVGEWVDVYYEHLLKLASCLQVKATDVFFIIIFRVGLQSYLRLATTGVAKDTLIKHKEVTMICEESGPIITNYNVMIIHPKSKLVA
jgi:hypothetical protein